jgi:hypothetical protein
MLDGVKTALGLGIDNIPHMEMLALFQGGMGLDRISDVTCNILKRYFIDYTQEVCRRHNIGMQQFQVRNASWSEEFARWNDQRIKLPANPFLRRSQPVLLVPERFLRDIPVVTADGFWRYAWGSHSSELRADFNYDIARRVDARLKARLARQNPGIVLNYLQELEQDSHKPYPLSEDPKLLVNWYEAGAGMTIRRPLSAVPAEPIEFGRFVAEIVDAFRHNVEEQDGWQLLWYHGRSRGEKRVQALFRSCVNHYCRANDIGLSGESNAGRGPVDFKFSQGWRAQAVVEMKLMRNSGFWDGILAQTPRYALSEQVQSAIFVAVAYTDTEMNEERLVKIRRAAQIASASNSLEVIPVVVDARPKKSASNLRATDEARTELHGGLNTEDATTAQKEEDSDEDDD